MNVWTHNLLVIIARWRHAKRVKARAARKAAAAAALAAAAAGGASGSGSGSDDTVRGGPNGSNIDAHAALTLARPSELEEAALKAAGKLLHHEAKTSCDHCR